MQFLPIADSDRALFLEWANAEGWTIPAQEVCLFQSCWPESFFALRCDGEVKGFVSAVSHKKSGWIGNLIVPKALRGRGYGGQMFSSALATLQAQNLSSIWLTASELGLPIYEKSGFKVVDRIERWVFARKTAAEATITTTAAKELLYAADLAAWQEPRTSLLNGLAEQGQTFVVDETVALLQQEPALQIIGPWYSPTPCPRANRLLLQQILAAADPEVKIVVDMIASSPLRQLLAAANFTCLGNNALMVQGRGHEVDLSRLVALASLGSIG